MNRAERELARANQKRIAISEYKLAIGCTDCGYNENALALEFDHLPGSTKIKTVASMMYNSWDLIWAEVAKCEVVCANCHAIRTFSRMAF